VKVLAPEAVTKEAILLDDANPEDFNIEGQGIGVSDFQAQCDPEGCCSSSQSRADSRAHAFERKKNDAQTRYDNRLRDYDSQYNDIGGTEGRDRLLEQQWAEWTRRFQNALSADVLELARLQPEPYMVRGIKEISAKLEKYCPNLTFENHRDFLNLCSFGCLQKSMTQLRVAIERENREKHPTSANHSRQLSDLHSAMWRYMNNEERLILDAKDNRPTRPRHPVSAENWRLHHKTMNKLLFDLLTCGKKSLTSFERDMETRYV